MVDTGIDDTHPFLSGKVLPGYDFIDGDQKQVDENRHGIHVAGTVIDCIRNTPVSILPVRVLGADGHGTTVSVAAGVKYAANHDADVINMSLSGDHSPSLEAAIEYAISKGSLICVSAGNDNSDTAGQCPAHITNGGVVVSAGNSYHNKAGFSNYGSSVDLMAPGVNIKSSVPGNRFILLDDTSMATPHASAVAILLDLAWGKQLSPSQLEDKIHAATFYGTWHDSIYGYGFLDMSRTSVSSFSTSTPTPFQTPEPEDTREVIGPELAVIRNSDGYVQSFEVKCNVLNGSTMTGWSVT